jgi:hypothetical protein
MQACLRNCTCGRNISVPHKIGAEKVMHCLPSMIFCVCACVREYGNACVSTRTRAHDNVSVCVFQHGDKCKRLNVRHSWSHACYVDIFCCVKERCEMCNLCIVEQSSA